MGHPSGLTRIDVSATLRDTMKLLLALLLTIATASAQNITKVTTVVFRPTVTQTNFDGNLYYFNWVTTTNVIVIPAGEAARVSTKKIGINDGDLFLLFVKEGAWFEAEIGDVVQGPVDFHCITPSGGLRSSTVQNPSLPASMLTLERWKVLKK